MTKYLREYIDKVDKVEIQAKNAGYQVNADKVHFCSGYQGYQGSQLVTGEIQTDEYRTRIQKAINEFYENAKNKKPRKAHKGRKDKRKWHI